MRVPFLGASVLPCLTGAALAPGSVRWPMLLTGAAAVAAAHLAGNVANEMADAESGADSRDLTPYRFFGGSKVLQEGLRDIGWYRRILAGCLVAALAAFVALAALAASPLPLVWGGTALWLSLAYSLRPWQLMSRGLGELLVAMLFGPATVLAGWACRGGSPEPTPTAWLAAVALGLLTAAVLVANEVPDAADDAAVGKRHLVVRMGQGRGWLLYAAANLGAGLALLAAAIIARSVLMVLAAAAVAAAATAVSRELRQHPADKRRLVAASIRGMQAQAGAALLLMLHGWTGR